MIGNMRRPEWSNCLIEWCQQPELSSKSTEGCCSHKVGSSKLGKQVVPEPVAAPAQVLQLGLEGGQALLLARMQVAQLARLALVLPGQVVLLLGRPARTHEPAEYSASPGGSMETVLYAAPLGTLQTSAIRAPWASALMSLKQKQ